MDKNLPVDMIIVEPTAIDGEHVAPGHIIKKCETELAMDLAASGKARPATPELIAHFKERAAAQAKAEKEAAAAAEVASANALAGNEALANMVARAIAAGVAQATAAAAPAGAQG